MLTFFSIEFEIYKVSYKTSLILLFVAIIFIVVRAPPQEKCKIGMVSPNPSGFRLRDTWRPLFCNLSSFPSTDHVNSCLKDKMIYLMGDSTLRQWFLYLVNMLKSKISFFYCHCRFITYNSVICYSGNIQ